MSKTARLYQDTRAASAGSGLDRLNDDLQDVTRIMTKNMEELLWRGDSLDSTCSSGAIIQHTELFAQGCRIYRVHCVQSQKNIATPRGISISKLCYANMLH